MERKISTWLKRKERKISPWMNRTGNFNWIEVEISSHQLNGMQSLKENKRKADISTSKEEKTKYFTLSGRERYIVRKMYSSQSLQDWKMCFNVLMRLGKLCCWMLIKKQGWKMKSFSISYLIFTGFWKMVTGHSKTLLCENESHVRMKIIVLSFKFSADLLLLMFVWDETGSAKKKNLFYMYSAIHLDH